MNSKFKERLISEFKRTSYLKRPIPQKNWGLIWVLSADQIDIKKDYKKRNETKERFETGLKLAKNITSLRSKQKKMLSLNDIIRLGPEIYFSGYNSHNRLMRKYIDKRYFEKRYKFPSENVIIGPYENIRHTDNQFQKFPKKLISKNRKIIIVTSTHHIPRVRRYLAKYPDKFPKNKIIICPSSPLSLDKFSVELEIEKILKYTQSGILPSLDNL